MALFFQRRWYVTIFGLFFLVIMLFPIYWTLISALETQVQIFHAPPYLFPPTPSVQSFFTASETMGPYMLNSAIIALGTVALSLVLGAPAAFALAHLRLRLTAPLVLLFLITQMFPTVMLATPLFLIFNSMGLVNSYLGLILANTTGGVPLVILLLRPYLLTVPFDLSEAAMIDGASLLGALFRIILPLSLPGLLTAGMLVFMNAWGDFLFGLTLTTERDVQPVALGLYNFVGRYLTNWNDLMAAAILTAIPSIIVLIIAQNSIAAGLTRGALK